MVRVPGSSWGRLRLELRRLHKGFDLLCVTGHVRCQELQQQIGKRERALEQNVPATVKYDAREGLVGGNVIEILGKREQFLVALMQCKQ